MICFVKSVKVKKNYWICRLFSVFSGLVIWRKSCSISHFTQHGQMWIWGNEFSPSESETYSAEMNSPTEGRVFCLVSLNALCRPLSAIPPVAEEYYLQYSIHFAVMTIYSPEKIILYAYSSKIEMLWFERCSKTWFRVCRAEQKQWNSHRVAIICSATHDNINPCFQSLPLYVTSCLALSCVMISLRGFNCGQSVCWLLLSLQRKSVHRGIKTFGILLLMLFSSS